MALQKASLATLVAARHEVACESWRAASVFFDLSWSKPMQAFLPYLNFDGNTREAMTFYQKCFGGQLDIQSFQDANIPSPGNENRVMHARLESGPATLMASDTMPGHPFTQGTNMHITAVCETVEEIDRLFAAMSEG